MFSFQFSILTSWNDYFSSKIVRNYISSRAKVSLGSIYLYNCFFEGFGKVLNCTGFVDYVLIEEVSFYRLNDDDKAGCIYICCDCQCVMTRICAMKCNSIGEATFSILNTKIGGICFINISSLVFSNCDVDHSKSFSIFGRQTLYHTNASNNYCNILGYYQFAFTSTVINDHCIFQSNFGSFCIDIYINSGPDDFSNHLCQYSSFYNNTLISKISALLYLQSQNYISVISNLIIKNIHGFIFYCCNTGSFLVRSSCIPYFSEKDYHGTVIIESLLDLDRTNDILNLYPYVTDSCILLSRSSYDDLQMIYHEKPLSSFPDSNIINLIQ